MDHRDWVAWVVDVAQVVGAFVGVVAFVVAWRSIVNSKKQVTHERRLDFELTTLKELAQQPVNVTATRIGLTAALGPAIVPMACAYVTLEGTSQEVFDRFSERLREMRETLAGDPENYGMPTSLAIFKILQPEVIEQIRKRVEKRG
jgi:hypothetical protein